MAKVNISRQHDETQSCLRETTAADSRSAAHTLSGRPECECRLTSAQRPTPLKICNGKKGRERVRNLRGKRKKQREREKSERNLREQNEVTKTRKKEEK
jgi:hypothetical protein